MHIPESLKNALLVFVVVLLVYVLYQRLLVILGKKERDKRYVTLSEKIEWTGKKAQLSFTLFMNQHVAVLIYDNAGNELQRIQDKEMTAGLQVVDVDCSTLAPGRYYFRITAAAHDSSVYFNIV
jgi:steroid 5-alpha reductase family enzyme